MGHDHEHSAGAGNQRQLAIVLALTSVYLVAEVIGGLLTHSLALLADAGHMLTDVGGLALALLAIRFARRPATPERTYGYYRIEILAALANAVVLIVISLYILFEAYQRFRHPPEVASQAMLGIAAVGLVINIVGVIILKGGSSKSLNVKGAYFEVLSDMLASIAVIAAGIVMWTTGWYYADPLLSAGIGLFILPRTWKLLGEAVGVLLEGTPAEVNLVGLREALSRVEGVVGVHDLHVWSLTSGMNAMSVHVVRADSVSHDDVLATVRKVIPSFGIQHATVQIESAGCAAEETHL
jgi:cobalt-zinc-cadmium efflux system protein